MVAVIWPPQAARMPQRPTKKTTSTMPAQPRMEPLSRDLGGSKGGGMLALVLQVETAHWEAGAEQSRGGRLRLAGKGGSGALPAGLPSNPAQPASLCKA